MSNEKEDTVEQTHELVHETWSEYFDAASRELFNAPVSIEIETPPWPPQTEVDRLALQLLTYDRRDDVFEVFAAQGGPHLPGVVRHMVDHPQRIVVDNSTLLAPMTIAVDDREGVRTVVRIERPAEFSG
jgi:hypothetical protein